MAHPYHLVDYSPWPILASTALFSFALSIISFLTYASYLALVGIVPIILIAILWWRDLFREAIGGFHTAAVVRGLKIGFYLFLLSEIMLFVSMFWAFLHSSLSPSVELASMWPPVGISAINPLAIPLLGSVILLASGFILTLSHITVVATIRSPAIMSLAATILFGALFLYLQFTEYSWAEITIADSVLGSTFYMTTGLHALHVIAGALFLAVSLYRMVRDSFTTEHHLGLESAAAYWHLVDVVWLAVFLLFYCW